MRDEGAALSLIGLSMRAGQVISGDDLCERAVRAGRVGALLLDAGASDNTRAKYGAVCAARGIPLREVAAGSLGRAIGRDNRMVVAIAKGKLSEKIVTLLS